jgi:hypothetical protein
MNNILYNIISTPRSGSTYLLHILLNSINFENKNNKNFKYVCEGLSVHNVNDFKENIEWINNFIKNSSLVIKNHINRIYVIEEVFKNLKQINYYINANRLDILCVRIDIQEQIKSLAYSFQCNKWAWNKKDIDKIKKINLNESYIQQACESISRQYLWLYDYVNTKCVNPVKIVTYNDIMELNIEKLLKNIDINLKVNGNINTNSVKSPNKENIINNLEQVEIICDKYFANKKNPLIIDNKLDIGKFKKYEK